MHVTDGCNIGRRNQGGWGCYSTQEEVDRSTPSTGLMRDVPGGSAGNLPQPVCAFWTMKT